jgi:hypothetical protein
VSGSLPPELEDLYTRIFQQIPKDYMHDAKIYFKLALMRRPIGLLDFFLATRNPKEALARKTQSSYEDHLTMKDACTQAETRIKSRCRDLLHVTQIEKDKKTSQYTPSETEDITPFASVIGKNVEFLHLSFRNYIASKTFATSSSFELGVDVAFIASSVSFFLKLLKADQLFQICFWADRSWADRMTKSAFKFSLLLEYTQESRNHDGRQFSGFGPI